MRSHDVLRHEARRDKYDAHHWKSELVDCARSIYYPLYRAVCRYIGVKRRILEVGCGTGALAHHLLDTTGVAYCGFDFSPVAIQRAGERTGRNDCFFVGDARAPESYRPAYDTIVCLEVLEHIEHDLDVVANWKSGCECICSVPNFDYETHVRLFRYEREITSRYGHLISIHHIERIACPLVQGRGWSAYLRQLRWSRNNPRRLLGLLGYQSFEYFAGWFLFCGTRR
jgi:2-polyprenyl-3-methyl-5-hydroxy-6-metoxy-1,4-benzoquinol methylase